MQALVTIDSSHKLRIYTGWSLWTWTGRASRSARDVLLGEERTNRGLLWNFGAPHSLLHRFSDHLQHPRLDMAWLDWKCAGFTTLTSIMYCFPLLTKIESSIMELTSQIFHTKLAAKNNLMNPVAPSGSMTITHSSWAGKSSRTEMFVCFYVICLENKETKR